MFKKLFISLSILSICLFAQAKYDSNTFYSDSWALIIGINDYQNVKPLNYAVADAKDIKELLINEFDFPEENIQLLLNKEATLDGIKRNLKELSEKAQERDRVLIYFAGHGETEELANGGERGYLIPINGKKDDLYLTALPMDEIKNFSNMTSAKDVLFLMDACYSGLLGMVGARGLTEETNYSLEKIARGGSRQVITAGRRGEISIEKPEWGHSAFAKNLIKGLKAGMADLNNNGVITGSELGIYLQDKVTQDTKGVQTPDYDKFTNDDGEFIFIYIDGNSSIDKITISTNNAIISESDSLETNNLKNALVTFGTEGVFIDSSIVYSEDTPEWLKNVLEAAGMGGEAIEEMQKEIAENLGVIDDDDELVSNSSFSKSTARHFAYSGGDWMDWMRYNRSEGLFYQFNGTFQSTNVPGSSFYGGIGRAFHKNQYQWILGYEQLITINTPFWTNTVQFYFESFNKSITQDAWRMADEDNSISAFLLSKDYLDWYNGQGFRTAAFVHIKNYLSVGAEYNTFNQSNMRNVIDGDNYRPVFSIQEGDNTYLKTMVSLGYPIDLTNHKELQMYTTLIKTNSLDGSDINYNYDHFFFNLLFPYTDNLSFNIKLMAGASDIDASIWKEDGFKQNIFEIGGAGTLRGYPWKGISSSHYALSSLEVWIDYVGFFYDRAVIFESPGNIFNDEYVKDLADNLNENVRQGIGVTFGDDDWRISFAKQIDGNSETTIYLSTYEPIQYW